MDDADASVGKYCRLRFERLRQKEMRRSLNREFRRCARDRVSTMIPGFSEERADGNDLRFARRVGTSLSLYVVLCVTSKDDAFTVEVAWSEEGEYPGDLRQFAAWLYDDATRGIVAAKLVDGGLIRNFPASDLKAMGADIIIGSNVSSGLLTAEKLLSPVQILMQIAFFKEARAFGGFVDLFFQTYPF